MKGIIHNENHVICNECHLTFKGIECYNQHKIEKSNKFWKCTQCKITITERKNEHKWGEKFCKNCKTYTPSDHQCYLKKPEGFKDRIVIPDDSQEAEMIREKYNNTHDEIAGYIYPNKYIYFDWEAYTGKDGIHRFN